MNGYFTERMEDLPALTDDAVKASLDMVDKADVYIGLFAHRYGYVPRRDNPKQVSITEMEYDRAVQKGIPRLIFLMADDQPVLPKDFEGGPAQDKLQLLKEKLGADHVADFFTTPADLFGKVYAALSSLDAKTEPSRPEEAEGTTPPAGFRSRPTLDDSFRFLGALAGLPPPPPSSPSRLERAYFSEPDAQAVGYAPPLFVPFDERAGERASVQDLFARWISDAGDREPLVLVSHFGPDAREALLCLAVAFETQGNSVPGPFSRIQWVFGEELVAVRTPQAAEGADRELASRSRLFRALFNASETNARQARQVLDRLESLPPTLFLVDFSSPKLALLLQPAPGRDEAARDAVANFQDLCARLPAGHRVVLALPRWLMLLEAFRELVGEPRQHGSTFIADELFSSRYGARFEQCERALGEGRVPAGLESLLHVNSNLCVYKVAAVLRNRGGGRAGGSPSALPVREAMQLAASLAQEGFHEVAVRLEQHCRTRNHAAAATLVSLAADVKPPAEEPLEVIALLEGLENIPRVIKRAKLTGSGGAGKTASLLQIEHEWSLPRFERRGRSFPAWLPLYIPLSDRAYRSAAQNGGLRFIAPPNFQNGGGESYRLAAHDWVKPAKTLADLRWLFSSPVMFLVDGMDTLPDPDQAQVSQHLEEMAALDDTLGLVVASREEKKTKAWLIRVRELNERQLGKFLALKMEHSPSTRSQDVKRLLDLIDRPISRLVRNPYLLDKLCHLTETVKLEDLNLYELMTSYVEYRRVEYGSRDGTRIVCQWLPEVALLEKRTGEPVTPAAGSTTARYAQEAWEMGFLRSPELPAQFTHDLLRDYFAARQLGEELALNGERCLEGCPRAAEVLVEDWEDLFRVLLGHLSRNHQQRESLLGGVVNWLAGRDLRLALRCILDLPPAQAQTLAAVTSAAQALARKLQTSQGSPNDLQIKEGILDAEALGCLDVRLELPPSLKGFIEIGRTAETPAFKIGRYPVTNLEFSRFIAEGGYEGYGRGKRWWKPFAWKRLLGTESQSLDRPRYWRNHQSNKPNQPVVGVSFFEALAYCEWLSEKVSSHTGKPRRFSLPTEAQWLRALGLDRVDLSAAASRAKAIVRTRASQTASAGESGTGRVGGEETDGLDDAFVGILQQVDELLAPHRLQLSRCETTPVGLFAPVSSGCYDFLGNIWEWCDEWHPRFSADRPSATEADPQFPVAVKGGPVGGEMSDVSILYGGCFDSFTRFHKIGFRVCCD